MLLNIIFQTRFFRKLEPRMARIILFYLFFLFLHLTQACTRCSSASCIFSRWSIPEKRNVGQGILLLEVDQREPIKPYESFMPVRLHDCSPRVWYFPDVRLRNYDVLNASRARYVRGEPNWKESLAWIGKNSNTTCADSNPATFIEPILSSPNWITETLEHVIRQTFPLRSKKLISD